MWEFAQRLGTEVIFVNLGSDHSNFIEAFATLEGKEPRIVVCPHEMTALTVAHGYAIVTRRPQMSSYSGHAKLGDTVRPYVKWSYELRSRRPLKPFS